LILSFSQVSQDPVLFSGSVADNIAYGMEEDDVASADWLERVEAAARAGNAHEFIIKLPQG
jgi:ATP-binding cassette subfamily B (MDR/TAP) protein 8